MLLIYYHNVMTWVSSFDCILKMLTLISKYSKLLYFRKKIYNEIILKIRLFYSQS